MGKDAIVVNTRNINQALGGVQRYTIELSHRLESEVRVVNPGSLSGPAGHFWEQFILPIKVGNNLLWSPGNTGPLSVRNQVVTIHDVSTFDFPEDRRGLFTNWYRWLLPRLANEVKRVITVSHFSQERIVGLFNLSPEKVSTVYNGVNRAVFYPRTEEEIRQMRSSLGVPEREYVLTVLSSLTLHKNPKGLLNAWNQLNQLKDWNYQLVIAGASANSRIFKEFDLAPIPANVTFLGHVGHDYLPALYSGAALFVYPSLYDSCPFPPIEAMACGLSIVSSDRAALPEILGEAAVYVDPTDPQEFSEAIGSTLLDMELRDDLARAGRERLKLFSWENCATATLRVLREAQSE